MKKIIILILTFILLTSFTYADYIDDMNNGSIFYSKLENGNEEVLNNTAFNITATNGVGGIINNKYVFDGSSDFISYSDKPEYDVKSISIFGWVKSSGFRTSDVFMSRHTGGSNNLWIVGTGSSSDELYWYNKFNDTTVNTLKTTTANLQNNVWNHVVFTYNMTTGFKRIYVNGVEKASFDTSNTGGLIDGSSDLEFGVRWTSTPTRTDYFLGDLDEWGIVDFELTPTQINFSYNSGNPNTKQQYIFFESSLLLTTLNYPINTTHYSLYNINTSLIYNGSIVLSTNKAANCSINNSYWNEIQTGNLTHVFNNTTPVDGNYSINYICTDNINITNDTFWFIIDTTTPSITLNNILNNSNQFNDFYLNISVFDAYLYLVNINLTKNGSDRYFNTSGELSGSNVYYNHTHLINISNGSYSEGYYTLFIEAWDTHTNNDYFVNEQIDIKRVLKQTPKDLFRVNNKETRVLEKLNKNIVEDDSNFTIENEIEFKFKDHKLKIRTPEQIEVNYKNERDRLTLNFKASNDFNKGLTYKIIEGEKNIKLLENSPYNFHFIIDDNIWYDCEGLNVIAADRINNTSYKIYYMQDKDIEESHSFGGLNYFNSTYIIYIGHTNINYFIKDSSTLDLINNQSISFDMFYSDSSNYYNYTINNGTLYDVDIESGNVDITISSSGYNTIFKSTTITEGFLNSKTYYLTNSSLTTGTILKIIDSTSNPIENSTITIYQYINNSLNINNWNAYTLINTLQTNFQGETTSQFIQETQYYRFKIYVNDLLIEETSPSLIFRDQINFQISITPSQLQSLLFLTPSATSLVENIVGLNYTYTFSWSGGDLKGGRLTVTKRNLLGGEEIIKEEESSLAFGSLFVSFIPDEEGKYVVEGWVDTNTENSFFPTEITEINFSNNFAILKTVGLFISYIIILALSLLMTQHPAGSIIGCCIGLIFAATLGILNIATGSLILIITIGGIVIYLNKY